MVGSRPNGSPDLVLVGVIVGAHGLNGDLWIKSFTGNPADVGGYGTVSDADGRRTFDLRVLDVGKGKVLVRIDGVTDRNGVDALKGTELFVPRSVFPEPDADEFYLADLVGLAAETVSGDLLGVVCGVHDYGAGNLLEIARPEATSVMVPFTKAHVPTVDIAGGKVVVDPPTGWVETDEEE